jgi:hypothetical protein
MSLNAATPDLTLTMTNGGTFDITEETLAGLDTEHIYIGDEFSDSPDEPRTVRTRERLVNRVRGIVTELTLYEEGFLRVREGTSRKVLRNHLLELRFIDPEPTCSKRTAMHCLRSSLGLGVSAVLAWFILPLTNYAAYAFSATTVAVTAAVVTFLMFVYRSEETTEFRTMSGKVPVLRLTGSFGCVRQCRKAAATIRQLVDQLDSNAPDSDQRYLRAEMQAHYRLAETGVITRRECSDGTALILSRFG